jgi:peptide/nickel transport system permease protein
MWFAPWWIIAFVLAEEDGTITMTTQAEPIRMTSETARRFRRHPAVPIGLSVLLLILLISVFAPFIAPHDPQLQNIPQQNRLPDREYLFGTNYLGQDVFSQVLYGGRISLLVGAAVTLLAVGVGTFFGLIAGYFRPLDPVIMRIADGLMAFPSLLLAIALGAAMGPGLNTVILALAIAYLPRVVRIMRGSVIVVRELEFVEAASAIGCGAGRVVFKHILPNVMGLVLVQISFIFSSAVLGEAALGFLGVGVPPEIPSWGAIMNDGRSHFATAPWLTLSAGLAIMLTVLALNLTGDGLRDMLDPRLQKLK